MLMLLLLFNQNFMYSFIQTIVVVYAHQSYVNNVSSLEDRFITQECVMLLPRKLIDYVIKPCGFKVAQLPAFYSS